MAKTTSKGYATPGTGEGSGGLTDADGNPVMTETQKEMEAAKKARDKMLEMERQKRMQGTKNRAYGGKVMKMSKGGKVKKSNKSRGDGIAQRGRTKGRMV
tara:strand:- start:178 stop:477 length:300 start_codon:yes stop_codon:yes gene_type:complete